MRVRARKDANHPQIVKAFKDLHCSVVDLAQIGRGCPDLLVGVHGHTILVEIKDGNKPASERKLTPDQSEFFQTFRGFAMIVYSVADVEMAVRAFTPKRVA